MGTINSVDRTLNLIELLFRHSEEMGITEIANAMNEYKSTIHRTLGTLGKHGYVIQNPVSGKYGLGPKLYVIGLAADNQFMLRETVRPFADSLLEEFQETVNVAMPDRYSDDKYRFLVVYRAEGKGRILRLNSLASSNGDCHCSSLGKSLLAYTPNFENIVKNMTLYKHNVNTIVYVDDLIQHLHVVRENGFALDAEELEMGLTCVGVPILNHKREAILAISISGTTSRVLGQLDTMVTRLKEVANQIANKLH